MEGEPILASEVEALVSLRLVDPIPGESEEARSRRALDLLVDERLRARDLARFGEPEIGDGEIEREIDRAAVRVGGREQLLAIARHHGLEPEAVRAFFRRQIAAIRAAEDRFGGAVFVTDAEVSELLACDPAFRERLAAEGFSETPKLDPALAAEVRNLIIHRRVGEQVDRWMAGLRAKAQIEYRDGR